MHEKSGAYECTLGLIDGAVGGGNATGPGAVDLHQGGLTFPIIEDAETKDVHAEQGAHGGGVVRDVGEFAGEALGGLGRA